MNVWPAAVINLNFRRSVESIYGRIAGGATLQLDSTPTLTASGLSLLATADPEGNALEGPTSCLQKIPDFEANSSSSPGSFLKFPLFDLLSGTMLRDFVRDRCWTA